MEGVGFFLGESLAIAALVIFWYMLLLYLISLARRDMSVIASAWGPGIMLAALAVLWWHAPAPVRPVLATVLVSVWGLRLALHVFLRDWRLGENPKFEKLRTRWGIWWPLRSFLQMFMAKGVLLLIVALPVLWINTYGGAPLGWLDLVGALVWLGGFLIEVVADAHLTRFQKDPAHHGRTLKSGLRRLVGRPNYLGEVLMWWGLWLLAVSVPGGWISIIGPITLTLFLSHAQRRY